MSYFFIKCEFSLSDYSFQSGNGEILGTVSLIVSIFHFIQYPSIPAKLLQQHQKFPDPKTYHSSIDHLSYNSFPFMFKPIFHVSLLQPRVWQTTSRILIQQIFHINPCFPLRLLRHGPHLLFSDQLAVAFPNLHRVSFDAVELDPFAV